VNLWYGRQKRLKSVSIGQVWRPDGVQGDTALTKDDAEATKA
jgi:preprotein translocase subunit SecD